MKFALHLVVILIFAVSQAQAEKGTIENIEEYIECKEACEIKVHECRIICTESGRLHYNRCELDCARKDPGMKPADLKEVECKPGSYAHCWNTECTEDERKHASRGVTPMCKKIPPHSLSQWPCHEKCEYKEKNKNELELIPCSEVKKE